MALANFCTQCGQRMQIESNFCSSCGTKRETFKELNAAFEAPASGNQLKDFDLLQTDPNIGPSIKKDSHKDVLGQRTNSSANSDTSSSFSNNPSNLWPPPIKKDSHKDPSDKKVLIRVSGVIAVLSIVLLIIVVTSQSESVRVSSSESVCVNLNSEVYSYFDYLQGWTVDSNSMNLATFTEETANRIRDIAQAVANDNIEWDSGPIVTNLLMNVYKNILDIGLGVLNGKFPAGDYESFKSLYPELDLNFQSVMNSACNQ